MPTPLAGGAEYQHLQIGLILREAISRRELVVGERLPPERVLATAFGVSRMTLRHALAALELDGVIERRRGRDGGTFIAESRVVVDGLVALSDRLRGVGLRAGARVLDATVRVATGDERATLGEPSVYAIRRVRYATGRVTALERAVFPTGPFPGLLEHPLAGSLERLLRDEYQDAPLRATERLEATTVRADEAPALGLEIGAPVLLVRRVAYGRAGRAVELSHTLYRVDRTRVIWESKIVLP